MSESYDYLFKFLIIGRAGSGKSCLLHHFIENKFKEDSSHTIGVEFGSRIVNVGGKSIKLQIWDTAGQERFRSVTRSYYRGAAGALLVYDSTSRDSFNVLSNWLNDARTLASQNICILLVGNKKDLEEEREVTFLEASTFAQENELIFLETSARTGENVEEAFLKCSKTILAKIETGELDPERIGSGIQYGDTSMRGGGGGGGTGLAGGRAQSSGRRRTPDCTGGVVLRASRDFWNLLLFLFGVPTNLAKSKKKTW